VLAAFLFVEDSMRDTLLLGQGQHLIPIPRLMWQEHISKAGHDTKAALSFMSEEHHLVRNFVVRELPRVGEPLSPDYIAGRLNLPVAHVIGILDDLEKHMTFLFRNEQGAVTWAYPVTIDRTPHHLTFSTGEQVYAA
jgi:hypothetical protein